MNRKNGDNEAHFYSVSLQRRSRFSTRKVTEVVEWRMKRRASEKCSNPGFFLTSAHLANFLQEVDCAHRIVSFGRIPRLLDAAHLSQFQTLNGVGRRDTGGNHESLCSVQRWIVCSLLPSKLSDCMKWTRHSRTVSTDSDGFRSSTFSLNLVKAFMFTSGQNEAYTSTAYALNSSEAYVVLFMTELFVCDFYCLLTGF